MGWMGSGDCRAMGVVWMGVVVGFQAAGGGVKVPSMVVDVDVGMLWEWLDDGG